MPLKAILFPLIIAALIGLAVITLMPVAMP
jgi:hypothetical protein